VFAKNVFLCAVSSVCLTSGGEAGANIMKNGDEYPY